MKGIKKGLAILLVLCTLLSMVVMTGAGVADASQDAQPLAASNGSFMKMVQLDGGRGYISVDNVKAIIDQMAKYDYDYLVLGFGNDGLRFLLDDMSVKANGTTYDGETIRQAIINKNDALAPNATGEWTQSDMETILSYAAGKGISIVPFLNTPGHATSIVAAMEACGIDAALGNRNGSTDNDSVTFDVTNSGAVAFVEAFVQKYIDYFSARGCVYFNLGMDEFAGNNGGWSSMDTDERTALGTYLNDLVSKLDKAGMTPLAFCDVIGIMDSVPARLIGINWNGTSLSGHSNINANQNWYYVLGATGTGWAGYDKALSNVKNTLVTKTLDGSDAAGSLLAIWNDNNVAFTADEVAKVNTLIQTQATSNSNYFTPLTEDEVWVTVNGTETRTIENQNYAGDYVTDNPGIATVSVEGHDATPATEKYTPASVSCNTLIGSSSTSWHAAGEYYYKADDGNYYPVYAKRSRDLTWTGWKYTYTWGYSTTNSSSNVTQIGTQETDSTGTSPNITVYTKSTIPATSASTTVTFTGKSVGTTYVTVGNVRYTVHVTAENLDGKTLTYHPWISDYAVYPEGYNQGMEGEGVAREVELSAKSPNVNSEAGVPLAELVENTGDWQYEGDTLQTYFWKGVVLASGNHQVNARVDRSMTGADFTYIRYWGGNWSYSSDRQTWTAVKDTDEVCAYYLMKTQVTDEVDTYVKDWAFTAADAKDHTDNRQKALSFAVVYPNGQMSPAENDIYQKSTLIYWDSTAFGFIRIGTNEVYEVEKITYTMGDRQNPSGNAWQPNETINWEKTQLPDGTTWYNETVCWDETYTTEPVVNGADLTEINNTTWGANDAVLILIYLKPVVTEDSLTVRYWDDSANSEIYNYPVNITNTAGEDTGTFLNRLKQTNDVNVGNFTLDDNAYVVNAAGKNETFEKDLTKVPNLFGKYTSGLYNYVSADISADGKTLTLHYNLDSSKLEHNYVLDFGLPVTVPLSDLVTGTNVTKVEASVSNTAGTATVGSDKSITFMPGKVMAGTVTMSVTVTYNDGKTDVFTVGFTPATTVYYEEGFGSFKEGAITGTPSAGNQTASAVGAGNTGANYGYDDAYSNAVGDSNGTVATMNTGDQGTFAFTGTGVDIYARTQTHSGKVMVYLYQVVGETKTLKRLITVDTRQLGEQSANATAYNVPIVSLSGLTRGEYTIRMLAVQTKDADGTKQNYPVYIDGFRVHGTLDVSSEVYQQDGEANPTFVELRNSVLNAVIGNATPDSIYAGQIADETMSQVYAKAEEGVSALIVTKGQSSALTGVDVQDLLDNGPKNEIYLCKGQSLVFTVNATSAQIGLKALNAATNYTINDQSASLNTSTDMFYPLTLNGNGKTTVTITNTGDGILSITELKLFGAGTNTASVEPMSAPALTRALVSLGYESEPVPATATLNITVQCGDKAIPVALTAEGMSNETHTFTAAEIKAAVEQALPEGYTVDGVAFTDVTVACGETSDVTFTAAEIPAAPVSLFQKIVQTAVRIVKKIFSWF